MTRILIEANWWVDGPPSLRRVLRESIQAWLAEFPEDELTLLMPRKHAAVARAELPDSVKIRTTLLRPQAVAAAMGTVIPSLLSRTEVVLTHNFASLSPFSRRVVLIHDLMFCEHPEWFTPVENRYFSLMPALSRFSDLVLATSVTEAHRIANHIPRTKKIVDVGLGLSPELLAASRSMGSTGVDGLEAQSFVLSVGRLNARKNLMKTIRGALVAGILTEDFPLVVVGSQDGLQDSVPVDVRAAIDAGLVRYTGFVSDEQLAWLYQSCSFFTFLSLDEGYGLPPLEALHFGARVLVSDIQVFRELLSDIQRVTFCDPYDVGKIAEVMRGMTEYAEASESVDVSNVQARFDWSSVVRRMRAAVIAVTADAR